jgi:two-component system response regulator NreC
MQAVRAGAQDYLVKGQLDGERLVRVLRYAIERKHSENALRARIEQHSADPSQELTGSATTIDAKPRGFVKHLSHREREMVRLIAEGVTNQEMAKRLSVSLRTIERSRGAIMRKVGVQNRAELIAYARQTMPSGEDTDEFE